MGEMRSSKSTEGSLKSSPHQLTDHNIGTGLTAAWKSLSQSKAALRHIENHLEAGPGTGVILDSVMNPSKEKSSSVVRSKNGQKVENGGSSKHKGRKQQSPEKSSSRSPLRNTTQNSNVSRNSAVEFREPRASYREATPPSHPPSQLESASLQSMSGSSYSSSDRVPNHLVYQRGTRDRQTDRELDSTQSSALMSTEIRYLNNMPALDTLRTNGHQSPLPGERAQQGGDDDGTPKAQQRTGSQHSSPNLISAPSSLSRDEGTPSSSPGSVSVRLENLRRHQTDDKLEKLKERIRRQRQHLEEAAEREKLLSFQERPIVAAVGTGTDNMPTAKIRKVAPAPPAPIYKGFNSTETKIRTPDGRVWKEDEFNNLSREIYRDLQQFAEITRSRHQRQKEQRADKSKERKPVRKVHGAAAATASDLNAKPGISPASWREGEKLVKSILGPGPKLAMEEDGSHPVDRPRKAASHHHSTSYQRSKAVHQSHSHSRERPASSCHEPLNGHSPIKSSILQENAPLGVGKDHLSADIQGILDDLQLESKSAEVEERARQRSRGESRGRRGSRGSGSRTRTPVSAWGATVATGSSSRGCRSASPMADRTEAGSMTDTGHKKRHYDANAIRQYIVRQQEDRKKRQAEEKRAVREDTERRNQRLQELYRKQKEAARTVYITNEAPMAPVQKHLQETCSKLLLGDEATQMHPAAPFNRMRPMYQPSGESDKENKRLDAPLSPSSSDRSLTEHQPLLSRNDLDVGVASLLQTDHLSPAVRPQTSPNSHMRDPSNEHFLSQLLRLETAMAAVDLKHRERPATVPNNRSHSKISRLEALKATAASLSIRLESEARKIAGEGTNHGTTTAMDMDSILAPLPSQAHLENGCWAETGVLENNDVASDMQRRLTSTGHSVYNTTVLPGVGNLHNFRGQNEMRSTHADYDDITGPKIGYTQEQRTLVNGLENEEMNRTGYDKVENRSEFHHSSTSSISEGPILSEASFSEDEERALPSRNRAFIPADGPEAVDYSASKRRDYPRLSAFQKEAAKCSALMSSFAHYDNTSAAWEELNKGSPLSVINIFTKNLQQIKVNGLNSPSAQSCHSANALEDAAAYEDDFVSPQSSRSTVHSRKSPSVNSHFEELMWRSYEKSTGGISSHRSPFQSPIPSQRLSSDSVSGSSPHSKHSNKKRGTTSDNSDATLVDEHRSPCSPLSEESSFDSRKRGSDKSSAHSKTRSIHSSDNFGESSGHFQRSLGHNGKKSPAVTSKHASPVDSPASGSPPRAVSSTEHFRGEGDNKNTGKKRNFGVETRDSGDLQYSPAVLQQRMAAEIEYLESVEESVRQLDNMERFMSVSMAQQESTSMAQLLKAKQQRHERDLYELKIKAEREALEAQLQLEENRQRMTRARIELQENLAMSQKETLEGIQEATTKMMSQQAEAARYTADAARHIKEMTELARTQITGAVVAAPVAKKSPMLDQQEQESSYVKEQLDLADSDSFHGEASNKKTRPDDSPSSLNSLSQTDSASFRRPDLSGSNSSSHNIASYSSTAQREQMKKEAGNGKLRKGGTEERAAGEAGSSYIEEEVPTAVNDSLCSDSIPSVLDDKGDTGSVATEYSLKFDESMTEDEIEERSFRSLLPSEAHRRGTMEKKSRHPEGSEDDIASHSTSLIPEAHSMLKPLDASVSFSGGQDSFSQFTMDMVRQYMKDEEVRLQHQSSLLHLRQKALREKTRTELAWLEHQKRRLRDKGEDDKMPPIRKKQRGLLLKLQQEQAEIKRLQEANKAARKERQLLLKHQEEIERMRNTTLRLKERLKSAGGEAPPEMLLSEMPASQPVFPSTIRADENRSPSPSLSISGSETSSIMQKLKKMRTHMDEKFLTKREQQLMQRRRHAEELLQWKQRLDQEEAEVRRMEKEALAAWDRRMAQDSDHDGSQSQKIEISEHGSHTLESRNENEKDYVSEVDVASATPESSIHTEEFGAQQPGSPSSLKPASVPQTPLTSVKSSPANYSQDFTSASPSPTRQSLILKGSQSPAASPSDGSSKTKMQLHSSSSRTTIQAHNRSQDSPRVTQTEPISDQSDIESRVKALKEELRKRKFLAYQLKKEQKKRHKEHLKAKEASLLKELESCNNFIEKTKAELKKESDLLVDTQSQIQRSTSAAEESSIKSHDHRSEKSQVSESEPSNLKSALLDLDLHPEGDYSRSTSAPELSDEDPPTVTPTPVNASPEFLTSALQNLQSNVDLLRPAENKIFQSGDDSIVSNQTSEIQEELEREVTFRSEDQHSEQLFKPEDDDRSDSQEKPSTWKQVPSTESEKDNILKPTTKSLSVVLDHKASIHPSNSSPSSTSSSTPESVGLSSKKETPMNDAEASSIPKSNCHGDIKSSVVSPPKEHQYSSEAESLIMVSPTENRDSREDFFGRAVPYNCHGNKNREDNVEEQLSQHSVISEPSHQSESLLDLHKHTADFRQITKSDNAIHSPPVSPLHTTLSPVLDELPSFDIGDRVLIGGVQPGTLRFKGQTSFANGFWAGVELDKSEGSNNGTYDGVVYFKCNESHGIFAPPDKITGLPEKFEVYSDNMEDGDSFFDCLSDKGEDKRKMDEEKKLNQGNLVSKNEHQIATPQLHSQHKESEQLISNGGCQDIILDLDNSPTAVLIFDLDKNSVGKQGHKTHQGLVEKVDAVDMSIIKDMKENKETQIVDTLTDELFNSFIKDTVAQFAEIKKAKEQMIEAANQKNREPLFANVEEDWISTVEQKDGLPFFPALEKEELTSPELCNRPESPVFGASGQEELAKRLAELELSRELDDLGDDQDWFDEDFGLSSRREQQRLKQRREEEEELRRGVSSVPSASMGGLVSSAGGEPHVKSPPRPELPLPLPPKLPEQPAMVVPHSAVEVEKMVHAATHEIWERCGLGNEGAVTLAQMPFPTPSKEYMGKEASSEDQEALFIRSYRKGVYDLTWEILQEVYAEDPNTDHPQWVKARRVKATFHRVKTPGDLTKVQAFVTAEVLKLYGLTKDHSQKTDWQKMLKFGRKKRDRVDHILVQELHEEEAQWVNYDEDELFVKMQLADSIFDALLKDTANVLTLICDKRANSDAPS